jgi:hypothetical protein
VPKQILNAILQLLKRMEQKPVYDQEAELAFPVRVFQGQARVFPGRAQGDDWGTHWNLGGEMRVCDFALLVPA